jgi:hypothetical protein
MCGGRRTAVVSGEQQPFKLRPGSTGTVPVTPADVLRQRWSVEDFECRDMGEGANFHAILQPFQASWEFPSTDLVVYPKVIRLKTAHK